MFTQALGVDTRDVHDRAIEQKVKGASKHSRGVFHQASGFPGWQQVTWPPDLLSIPYCNSVHPILLSIPILVPSVHPIPSHISAQCPSCPLPTTHLLSCPLPTTHLLSCPLPTTHLLSCPLPTTHPLLPRRVAAVVNSSCSALHTGGQIRPTRGGTDTLLHNRMRYV
jgi:hypothetical protein